MRIAFSAYDRSNYRGGPIVNARRLLPELSRRGHEVHAIVSYDGDSPNSGYLESREVKVHRIQRRDLIRDQIKDIFSVIENVQPDIYVPNVSNAGYYVSRWCREAGMPTVAAHRSDDDYHWGLVDRFVVGNPEWAVSGLVCVSQNIRDRVYAMGPEHTELAVIPSGVPLPEKVSQFDNRLKVVFVGNLQQYQKRILDVTKAFIRASEIFSDYEFSFIGDGAQREKILDLVEASGQSENIHLLGAVNPEDIHEELARHHVVVLMSDFEGTPGAIMDAMACGLVPVCLDISGINELVKQDQTGIIIKDRDDDFIDSLRRLSRQHGLWQTLSMNARTHIQEKYSLTECADRWERLMESLLMNNQARTDFKAPSKFKLPPAHPLMRGHDTRFNDKLRMFISHLLKFSK